MGNNDTLSIKLERSPFWSVKNHFCSETKKINVKESFVLWVLDFHKEYGDANHTWYVVKKLLLNLTCLFCLFVWWCKVQKRRKKYTVVPAIFDNWRFYFAPRNDCYRSNWLIFNEQEKLKWSFEIRLKLMY